MPTVSNSKGANKSQSPGKEPKDRLSARKPTAGQIDRSKGQVSPSNKTSNLKNQPSGRGKTDPKQNEKPKSTLGGKKEPALPVPKNISEVYLYRIPLFTRLKENYDHIAQSVELEKKSQIRDRMRRFEFDEIRQHAKRLETAIKMREESQNKLLEEQKLSPELIKFMKEYKAGSNDLQHSKEERTKRRAEMLDFLKKNKGFEDKKTLHQLANFKSQQNLFLKEKEKVKAQVQHRREFIKNILDPFKKDQQERSKATTSRIPTAHMTSVEGSLPSIQSGPKTARLKVSASQVVMPRLGENRDELKHIETKLKNLEKKGQDSVPYVGPSHPDLYGHI